MILLKLFLLSCSLAMAGCASDEVLRKSSGDLAIHIDQVSEDAGKFMAARTRMMKVRTATLAALEANALDSEQSNQSEISYHTAAGDTVWVELIERLRNAPDLVVQQRKDQSAIKTAAQAAAQNAKSAADFKTSKLTGASKALAMLAEEQNDMDMIAFYADFFKEVRKSVKDKADQAELTTNAAASASAQKGADVTSSADKEKAENIIERPISAMKASR
jgi:hypothetical protein